METFLERTERLFGKEEVEKLKRARVAVFGIGGVGGYVAEALVRSGVGAIDVFDPDDVHESNLNRQILALHSTMGQKKTEVFKARALDINPDIQVTTHEVFLLPENAAEVDFTAFQYVVDAIDTVAGKLAIIERCSALGVPVISAMGTGNKMQPELLEVADIYETSVCPLARIMRRELRKRNVEHLKVVYSKEEPKVVNPEGVRQPVIGSNAFVPATAGLLLASTVICDLIR